MAKATAKKLHSQRLEKPFKSAATVDSDVSDAAIEPTPSKAGEGAAAALKKSKAKPVLPFKATKNDRPHTAEGSDSSEQSSSSVSSSSESDDQDSLRDKLDSGSPEESVSEDHSEGGGESIDEKSSNQREDFADKTSERLNTFQIESNRSPCPFQPPSGFDTIPSQILATSPYTKLLQPSSLSGKEILRISLPSSLPVNTLASLSTETLSKGKGYLEYNNTRYKISVRKSEISSAEGEPQLLIPTAGGYTMSAFPSFKSHLIFERSLKIPNLPSMTTTQASSSSPSKLAPARILSTSIVRPPRPPRPQPEGLRMRFQPTGSLVLNEAPSSAPGPPAPFRRPAQLPTTGEPLTLSPEKKRRKKKGEERGKEKAAKRKAVVAPELEAESPTKKRRGDDSREEGKEKGEELVMNGISSPVAVPSPVRANGVPQASPGKTTKVVDMDALIARHLSGPQAPASAPVTAGESPSKERKKKKSKVRPDGAVTPGGEGESKKDHKKKRKRERAVEV